MSPPDADIAIPIPASAKSTRLGLRQRLAKSLAQWRQNIPSILMLLALKTAAALTRMVPRWVAYWIASRLADVVFVLWRTGRRETITNMRHVLGPDATTAQVRNLAHQAMRYYFLMLVEFLDLRYMSREQALGRVRKVRGLDYVHAAIARGRGVILVGVHHGCWDLAGVVASSYQWPISAVADTYHYQPLDRWVFEHREAWGIRFLSTREPQALRTAFKCLRDNEVLALVIDRPMNGEGIPVRFFDADITFPPGAAGIALRTGATVIPGYFVRQADNTFLAELLPPVEFVPTGNREQDVRGYTQAIVTRLEEIVRSYPEQWYAFKLLWDEDHRPAKV
ncbi:MAG: lysophospholipid acyltransferase family protein [Chloroflexi bacterium]|nr:lysophospholipid acyltransferase family protein [Chloroflexota bacterium]MBU1749125.1 lysophospholipid acyltransferase family protein [Chloroflexota bacterium]MBU1880202.1 lysophospholipid acyltransferase family protein [Chloroflexota bacterium]